MVATLNPALKDFWKTPARNRVLYGGRDSSKSWDAAGFAIFLAQAYRVKFLCTRQFQNKIEESVYSLLKIQIERFGLQDQFLILNNKITHKVTGSEFIFYGLWRNIEEIKSLEGVDVCWIEEAHNLTAEQWEILEPTIRKEGSQFWIIFNPKLSTDFVYRNFVTSPPPNTVVRKINYTENQFLSETSRQIIEAARVKDVAKYEHVYLGAPKSDDDSVIDTEWVMRAVSRWHDLQAQGTFTDALPVSAFGVDVADQGDDQTVIAPRCGYWVPKLFTYSNQDTMQTAGLVTAWGKKWPAATSMIDVIGIGAGVVSRCREQGVKVIGFNASESSDRKDKAGIMEFLNKRSAAWWNMREVLDPANKHDVALPDDPELIGDLTTPKWKLSSSGKIQVEGASPTVLFPEGLRARLGRSPDKGTAVVQAFWTPSAQVKKAEKVDNRPQIFRDLERAKRGQLPTNKRKYPTPSRL